MTLPRSNKPTYVAAFLLGALIALLLARPARSAVENVGMCSDRHPPRTPMPEFRFSAEDADVVTAYLKSPAK